MSQVCLTWVTPISRKRATNYRALLRKMHKDTGKQIHTCNPYPYKSDKDYLFLCIFVLRLMYVTWLIHTCNPYQIVQGGEDSWDALSCRSFFAKEPLIIGLFCGKWPMKIRHPKYTLAILILQTQHPQCISLSWMHTYIYIHTHISWMYIYIYTHAYILNIRVKLHHCDMTHVYVWHGSFESNFIHVDSIGEWMHIYIYTHRYILNVHIYIYTHTYILNIRVKLHSPIESTSQQGKVSNISSDMGCYRSLLQKSPIKETIFCKRGI